MCVVIPVLVHHLCVIVFQLSQTPVKRNTAQSMSGVVRKMVYMAASVMSSTLSPTVIATVWTAPTEIIIFFLK